MSQRAPLKLSLQAANPIEKQATWDDPEICESPLALIAFLVKHVSVDAKQLESIGNSIVFQANKPPFSDNKKIWVKTSQPYGIGYYAGGDWRISYEWPKHSILRIPDGTPVPSFVTKFTDAQVEDMGLETGYTWGIFNP